MSYGEHDVNETLEALIYGQRKNNCSKTVYE